MPSPVIEPMPPALTGSLRGLAPDDAQEASYLAASANTASFDRRSSCGIGKRGSFFVLLKVGQSVAISIRLNVADAIAAQVRCQTASVAAWATVAKEWLKPRARCHHTTATCIDQPRLGPMAPDRLPELSRGVVAPKPFTSPGAPGPRRGPTARRPGPARPETAALP